MVSMQTDKALDVMMSILPDIAAIMNDTEADDVIAKIKAKDNELETGDVMQHLIPLFARKYREELYRIVAAMQGVEVETIQKQDITKTIMSLSNGLRVYAGFFACCLHMARNM